MTYRLLTLGGLALTAAGGRPADASLRGRNLALLALLVRAGPGGMTRERLAAYLWPESDAERARHSLDQAVYTIRRTLEEDPFVSGGGTLALDDTVLDSDVGDFERALESGDLRRAVEQYGSGFLDGFHLSGALEFERWVDRERAGLRGRFAEALEALAEGSAAAGDLAGAVRYWKRLAASSPLSSRVAVELMRALERAGDRAEAVGIARVHASRVEEELGTAPDSAVLELAEELASPPPVESLRLEPQRGGREAVRPGRFGESPAARGHGPRSGPEDHRLRGVGLAALGVAVLAGVAVFAAVGDGARSEGQARVAVASFANETGDSAFAALGSMTADWITEGLVRTGLVRVVRSDARRPAAQSVVDGRIYRRGDSIWIRAHVVESADGSVVRSLSPVGAPAEDPVRALDLVRQQVLGALGTLYDPRIAAWSGAALRPPGWAAYREFAAGVEAHAVPRDLPAAVEHFRQAAELDPHYVLPRLWLAWAESLRGNLAVTDSVTRSLVSRRSEMSPLERAWHDRIATLLAGDSEGTYRAARRMVQIAPGSGWVISLASAALDTRRPEVAIAALEEAGIDNVGLEREHAWALLAAAHHMRGDYGEELAVTERAIESDGLDWGFVGPGVPGLAAVGRMPALERRLEEVRWQPEAYRVPRGPASALAAVTELRAHGFEAEARSLGARLLDRPDLQVEAPVTDGDRAWYRLQLLYELGRWAEAGAVLETLPRDEADFRIMAMGGLLAARRGDATAAREVERTLATISGPYLFGRVELWRARIHAALGDGTTAIRFVRKAFSEGIGAWGWHQLHTTRDFHGVRRDPRFVRLMDRPG